MLNKNSLQYVIFDSATGRSPACRQLRHISIGMSHVGMVGHRSRTFLGIAHAAHFSYRIATDP